MKEEEIQPASDEPADSDWGFDVQAMSDEIASQLGLSAGAKGVVVSAVDPESAAARAGLRRGDVILEANRVEIGKPEAAEGRPRQEQRLCGAARAARRRHAVSGDREGELATARPDAKPPSRPARKRRAAARAARRSRAKSIGRCSPAQRFSSRRAITILCTSSGPSAMRSERPLRHIAATGVSSVTPSAPMVWIARSHTSISRLAAITLIIEISCAASFLPTVSIFHAV